MLAIIWHFLFTVTRTQETHARARSCTCVHTHTRAHTRTHTRTHTHSFSLSLFLSPALSLCAGGFLEGGWFNCHRHSGIENRNRFHVDAVVSRSSEQNRFCKELDDCQTLQWIWFGMFYLGLVSDPNNARNVNGFNPLGAKQSFQLWYPGGQRLKVISFSWSCVKSPSKCFSNAEPTTIIASRDEKRWCASVQWTRLVHSRSLRLGDQHRKCHGWLLFFAVPDLQPDTRATVQPHTGKQRIAKR